MATIKSYTDLEQSKKLAEILPLESADMTYYALTEGMREKMSIKGWKVNVGLDVTIKEKLFSYRNGYVFPCWSLAALLKTLNFPSLTQNKEDEWEVCVFDHDNDDYIKKTASNPIDACVAMIERLYELKML